MNAIYRKEIRGFVLTPIGAVFIGGFLFFMNLVFNMMNIRPATSDMGATFSMMLLAIVILVPILTMRLFSEEFKMRTDQILLTAPINVREIVLGKFLASLSVFLMALVLTLLYPMVLSVYGNPVFASILGNYVAIVFVASAFISIGLFISSLTENQLISCVMSLILFLFIYFFLDQLSLFGAVGSQIAKYISFTSRYSSGFAQGIFPLGDIMFYLSVTIVFLFLTIRVIEKKRYS